MSCVQDVRVGVQRPRLQHLPAGKVSSAGQEAVDLAESCGLFLDDWQQWCLDNMLAERRDGRWCASQAVLILPRQNGKNAVLEALELAALYLFDDRVILHTAHLADTAAKHMQRMVGLISANPELDAITHPYFSNGKERIVRTDNGAQIEFVTRGRKTRRGASPQRVIFDEALFLTDEQIQAILPGMSAQSLNAEGAPQMVYTSSAPLPESTVLHRVRRRGMAGKSPSMFFAEWSCEEGVDPNDRDGWYGANPGMGIRISPEWVEDNELTTMSPEAFLVERLGVVASPDAVQSSVFPSGAWEACSDPRSKVSGPVRLALAVGPDLSWSAFAVAGRRADGLAHVEVTEHAPGTGWVVASAKAATAALGVPLAVLPKSPAAGLLEPLQRAGVPVVELSPATYAKACGLLQHAVVNAELRHINQPPLNAAVVGADVRPVGESWVWDQRAATVDITPLVAVTVAVGAPEPDGPSVYEERGALVL
jgi:phage terminase large subunit-like protein